MFCFLMQRYGLWRNNALSFWRNVMYFLPIQHFAPTEHSTHVYPVEGTVNAPTSSGVNVMSTAPMFSFRRERWREPGMGTM